jgi:DNA polymerase III subunit delta'
LLSRIKSQDHVVRILKNAIMEDKLSHSYLFTGPEGVGKFTTALYFAMAINCLAEKEKRPCGICTSCKKIESFTHPDFIYIFPTPNAEISPEGEIKDSKVLAEYERYLENKRNTPWKEFYFSGNIGIRVDAVRMLQHRINYSLIEGRYKAIIIERAEMMNVNSSNAFLKTLEEPPDDVIIIMVTSKPESLLPTIISRCQRMNFQKITRNTIENELSRRGDYDSVLVKTVARIANGNMEKAINLIGEQRSELRQKSQELIELIIDRDDLRFMEFIEQYKTSKTVREFIEIIQYLIVWLSDLSFTLNCPEEVINIDQLPQLEYIAKSNPDLDEYTPDLIQFLEQMTKRLEGNVNPHLVGIEIYNRLKQKIRS